MSRRDCCTPRPMTPQRDDTSRGRSASRRPPSRRFFLISMTPSRSGSACGSRRARSPFSRAISPFELASPASSVHECSLLETIPPPERLTRFRRASERAADLHERARTKVQRSYLTAKHKMRRMHDLRPKLTRTRARFVELRSKARPSVVRKRQPRVPVRPSNPFNDPNNEVLSSHARSQERATPVPSLSSGGSSSPRSSPSTSSLQQPATPDVLLLPPPPPPPPHASRTYHYRDQEVLLALRKTIASEKDFDDVVELGYSARHVAFYEEEESQPINPLAAHPIHLDPTIISPEPTTKIITALPRYTSRPASQTSSVDDHHNRVLTLSKDARAFIRRAAARIKQQSPLASRSRRLANTSISSPTTTKSPREMTLHMTTTRDRAPSNPFRKTPATAAVTTFHLVPAGPPPPPPPKFPANKREFRILSTMWSNPLAAAGPGWAAETRCLLERRFPVQRSMSTVYHHHYSPSAVLAMPLPPPPGLAMAMQPHHLSVSSSVYSREISGW